MNIVSKQRIQELSQAALKARQEKADGKCLGTAETPEHFIQSLLVAIAMSTDELWVSIEKFAQGDFSELEPQ